MRNLNAELARFGVNNSDLQALLGCTDRTVQNKLKGVTEFSVSEALKIRDNYFPGMRMGYLFAPDDFKEPVADQRGA